MTNLPQIAQVVELGLEMLLLENLAASQSLVFSALVGCPVLSTFHRQW